MILIIMCDASDYDVGAVLYQMIGKNLHVIAYSSRTLDDDQYNYHKLKKNYLLLCFLLKSLGLICLVFMLLFLLTIWLLTNL